jgi:hypothetical protein
MRAGIFSRGLLRFDSQQLSYGLPVNVDVLRANLLTGQAIGDFAKYI